MSVRHPHVAATAALLGGLWLVTPAAAHALVQPDPAGAYSLTAGRLWTLVAVPLGLAGVVIGGLVLARSAGRTGTGTGRRGAIAALAAGLAGAAIGVLVVAAAEGGPGTGSGIVGGFVALVVVVAPASPCLMGRRPVLAAGTESSLKLLTWLTPLND